jgi:hypothetical protein
MEKKVFEDTLDLLRRVDADVIEKEKDCRRGGFSEQADEYMVFSADLRSAIAFLEAGQGVDKEKAIATLRRLYHPRFNQENNPASVAIYDSIMPLLEALPKGD